MTSYQTYTIIHELLHAYLGQHSVSYPHAVMTRRRKWPGYEGPETAQEKREKFIGLLQDSKDS